MDDPVPPPPRVYKAPPGARLPRRSPPGPARPAKNEPSSPQVEAYQEAAVLTASREQLLLMLIDGALRFAARGRDALRAGKPSFEPLARAQKIVAELMSALRPEIGAEIYANLMGLYRFCAERLLRAQADTDIGAVDEALRVLTELRAIWSDAISRMNEEGRPDELDSTPQNQVDGSA